MATVSKFASANTSPPTGSGWTALSNPTYAYADDTNYASRTSTTRREDAGADYGFANFTSSDIPDGSTINSVTLTARMWGTNATYETQGLQGYLSGSSNGNEVTGNATAEATLTFNMSSVTLANLRAASTDIAARVRIYHGNTTTSYTGYCDWVQITVDYTSITTVSGSFTADAIIKATATGSLTANADRKATLSPTLTASADLKKSSGTKTATADAFFQKTYSGSLTANGTLKGTQPGSFKADAELKLTQLGSFSAAATTKASSGTKTFTADAWRAVTSYPITADAVFTWLRQSQGGLGDQTFAQTAVAGNLIILATDISGGSTGPPTYPAGFSQIIGSQMSAGGRYTSLAYKVSDGTETLIHCTYPNTTIVSISEWALPRPWRVDVSGVRTGNSSFHPYVDISPTTTSFALIFGAISLYAYSGNNLSPDANYSELYEGSVTPDTGMETIYRVVSAVSGTYRVGSTYGGADRFELAEAVAFVHGFAGGLTSDARIIRTGTGSFTADAVRFHPFSIPADATFKKTLSGSLLAQALLAGFGVFFSFTFDGIIKAGSTHTFSASAILKGPKTASFSANATFKEPWSTFTADAWIYDPNAVAVAITSDQLLDWTILGDYVAFWRKAFQRDAFQMGGSLSATIDLIIDWAFVPVIRSEIVLDWKIGERLIIDLDFDYRVTSGVVQNLTIDWGVVASNAVSTLTLNYQIERQFVATIWYDGQDVTREVYTRDCQFTTRAGGVAGTATVLMRRVSGADPGYVVGKTLDLKIGDDWVWRGWVTRVLHQTHFDYEPTDNLSERERIVRLEGTDINDLFNKRIVYNQDDPTAKGPIYSAEHTPDTTALTELFANWLDLSGDGLDTTTLVDHVGYINIDQPAYPIVPAGKWGEAMRSIGALPGAIFYIDPDHRVVFCDVDTPNATVALSDTDESFPAVGYREMTFTLDGTALTNDYLGWGLTGMSSLPIFERLTDLEPGGSVETHGLWQDATLRGDVYKPATLDAIVRTFIYGSPTNHRGHKDDRPIIRVNTFHHGFRVAQKVHFLSHAHGFDDVYPIRELNVMFPTDFNVPIYQLTLSHDIDILSFADALTIPGYGITVIEPIITDGGGQQVVTFPGIIIDSFSRVTGQSYWGTGEEVTWQSHLNTIHAFVNGSEGVLMAMLPEFYGPIYEDNTNGMSTWVPETAHWGDQAGKHIDTRNLLIKFSIGRYIRPFPVTVMEAGREGAGAEWVNPKGAVDYFIPGMADIDGTVYGVFERGSLGDQGSVGAFVTAENNRYWITLQAQVPPGSWVDRYVVVGDHGQSSSGWLHAIGGGLVPWQYRWAGGTNTLTSAVTDSVWWYGWSGGLPNIVTVEWWKIIGDTYQSWYFPGINIYEWFMAGPDVPSVIFNQKVFFWIQTGYGTTIFDRAIGLMGAYGYTSDGRSGPVFGLSTTANGTGGLGILGHGTKTIEPGDPYYMRIYRPNNSATFIKIWESGSVEPEDWTAKEQKDGWEDLEESPDRGIGIGVQIFPFQTYTLNIDLIASLPGNYGENDKLPSSATKPAPGTYYGEVQYVISSDPNLSTLFPYIPGSLTIWCNGTIQRNGIDFLELSPAAGTFQLQFTVEVGDKLIIRYYVQ